MLSFTAAFTVWRRRGRRGRRRFGGFLLDLFQDPHDVILHDWLASACLGVELSPPLAASFLRLRVVGQGTDEAIQNKVGASSG